MLMKIDDIKVRRRIRRDVGDLSGLKDSLRRYGLLNPITVNSRHELIAGERRLEAAKALGWERIAVNVVDISDKVSLLEMELEENNVRIPFTDDELLDGYAQLEKLRNPGPVRRFINAILDFFLGPVDITESERKDKVQTSGRAGFIGLLGIALVVTSGILGAKQLLNGTISGVITFAGIIAIAVGVIFTVRFFLLRRK